MKESVLDQWGNEIYLTDERWKHIISRHPDMIGYRHELLPTIQKGQRQESPIGSNKFMYWKKFRHLRSKKSKIRVIVQFEMKKLDTTLVPNNFIVTAYQI